MPPALDRIDHVHVFVADRTGAEPWYREILGLHRDPTLAFWSSDGGPLMLKNRSGTIRLAVFERPAQSCRSTIAFLAGASEFLDWLPHLEEALHHKIEIVDHAVCWSIYFKDPDDNPYEITCYDYEFLATELKRIRGQAPSP